MTETSPTLSFETFWEWLLQHPNCIVRAGTPDVVLFDDEDLHWNFAAEGPNLFVQLLHGKRVMGEIAVDSSEVAYVQPLPEAPDGEHAFELVKSGGTELASAYYFVFSHGLEDEEIPGHERAVH